MLSLALSHVLICVYKTSIIVSPQTKSRTRVLMQTYRHMCFASHSAVFSNKQKTTTPIIHLTRKLHRDVNIRVRLSKWGSPSFYFEKRVSLSKLARLRMSGVRSVILLLSLLLLFLNPCVPKRSKRENPSDLTHRHENVKENHDTAEKTQTDIKRENEDGIVTKEEIVRFGSAVICYWRRIHPLDLAVALFQANSRVTSYYMSYMLM